MGLLRRLFSEQIVRQWRKLALAALCLVVIAAMTAANAWLMKPALDHVLLNRDPLLFWVVPAAIVAVAIVKALAEYWESVLVNEAGQGIIADTQVRMFAHLMRADLSWLHSAHTGNLVSSFVYDATLLRDAVARATTAVARDSLTLVFLTVVMFMQNWQMALIGVVAFPLVALHARRLGRKSRKSSTRSQEETGRLTAILTEAFAKVRTVKAYGMETFETDRTSVAVTRRLRELMRVVRARAAASPAAEALGGITVALAVLYGGWLASEGHITPGEFFSFIASLLFAYRPIKSLATLLPVLHEGLAAAERIFAVLDTEATIRDRPEAVPLEIMGGEIRFEHVDFNYGEGSPALHDVNFTVPAGKRIALVGASGAGKSTILNLILRFYDPNGGRLLIDGQDLRDVTIDSLRRAIAFVGQETQLFDTTIRANIAYGRENASEDDIVAAARAAAAHDFIMQLPAGYETQVGENGLRLSGGQRQRIAIARAMLRNAPILLLDEATSSLDGEAEAKVQKALQRLMRGRTAVTVAHRLSTVIDADEIYVIDHGRIVECGRHEELLARGGIYARLFDKQFAGNIRDLTPDLARAGRR